jgi:hypothetical protein
MRATMLKSIGARIFFVVILVWCKVLNAVISGPLSGQMQGAFAQA